MTARTLLLFAMLVGACAYPPDSTGANAPSTNNNNAAAPSSSSSSNPSADGSAAKSTSSAVKESTACGTAASLATGEYARTITTPDGRTRTYHIHVPPMAATNDTSKAPPAMVLAFHGGAHTADGFDSFAHLRAKADASGYVLVLPEGIGAIGAIADGKAETWNAGSCCAESVEEKIDDVGFVGLMLDAIEKEICVDTKRIFSTGFSNGGMLSYRLACEMSDRIAAIASVSGGLGDDNLDTTPPTKHFECKPTRPVPVLHLHGTQDACYPFNGGASPLSKLPGLPEVVTGGFKSINDTIAAFVDLEKCGATTKTTFKNGVVECNAYDCPAPGHVELCKIEGGGHQWPGGDSWPGANVFCGLGQGILTNDIIANDAIWQFFEAHPMP